MEMQLSGMKVTGVSTDLQRDSATVSLMDMPTVRSPGKTDYTAVTIQAPLSYGENETDARIKKIAIEAARQALHDALAALDKHLQELP